MVIVVRDSDRDGASHAGGDRDGIWAAWHKNMAKTIYHMNSFEYGENHLAHAVKKISIPFSLPSSTMFIL